jgi:hypothetical protein
MYLFLYEYENWSLSTIEALKFREFCPSFGPKREGVTGFWKE